MVRITCEMCGSNELIKQDGEYVCQHCGTKYTTEEAQKLIIEVNGKLDISGSTIKIDNQDQINSYLQNARRAKERKNWEDAEKYYGMVKDILPDNSEAIIYSSFAKVNLSLESNDKTYQDKRLKTFISEMSTVCENYCAETYEETQTLINCLSNDIISMCSSYQGTVNGTSYIMLGKVNIAFMDVLCELIKEINDDNISQYMYGLIIKHGKYLMDNKKYSVDYNIIVSKVKPAYYRLKKITPAYHLPSRYLRNKLNYGVKILIIAGGVTLAIIILIVLLLIIPKL